MTGHPDATSSCLQTFMMRHPLLYEINTRCWLGELSEKHGRKITLANVPESEFTQWSKLGFTHIWLMGVWTTGPLSRAEALKHPDLLARFQQFLPGWTEEDVLGSPYSIAAYDVPERLGGESALGVFRRKLGERGMKLILDFVPNHVGLDHPWVSEHPEYLVQAKSERSGTFGRESRDGIRWIACGKDPYFAPWTDVAQLDYRNATTRTAMIELLKSIASRCDGVRCDMSMLVLNDIFYTTWSDFPVGHKKLETEFWSDAFRAVKEELPEFLFLAEAYWGLEGKLQSLGFDYTYDKHLCDLLLQRHSAEAARHVANYPSEHIARSAHFLENHDEPRVASKLSFEEHRAAALVILGLPGMRFLQHGQLTGARTHPPVQLGRTLTEPGVKEISELYGKLLGAIGESAVGSGEGKVLRPQEAWPGNPSHENFVLIQWQRAPEEFDLVVVNLAPHQGQCYAPLNPERLADFRWRMSDRLSDETHQREGKDLQERGLYLELPAHGAQIFRFTPISATR